jgi:type VII secretion integral membrane protein EccD
MSGTVMTGFCRITVVAPNVRVDVALPEDVPLAELLPDVLRMADQWQSEGAHAGFVLARLDGAQLDTGVSLAAQGVRNGDLLYLRPATDVLPPPVYDDVVDAIAQAVSQDKRMWGPAHYRATGLVGAAVTAAVGAWILWTCADPHGMPAAVAGILAVALTLVGGTRSRVYGDHLGGAVLGACAVPYAFLLGLGVLPVAAGAGLGRSHFVVGCSCVLFFSVLGGIVQERHDEAYLAAGLAAAAGAAAGAVGLATTADAAELAAGAGTTALAAIGFLPGLAMRAVRFPMPVLTDGAPQLGAAGQRAALPVGDDEPVDAEAVARRARRSHELLTGLVAACVLTVLASCLVLAFSTAARNGGPWADALAGVLGLAAVSRARLFRRAGQVGVLLGGGIAAEAVLMVGAALHVSAAARQSWFFGIVLAAGLILTALAFAVPDRSLSPRRARSIDLLDGLLLAAVIPVLLGVLNVYTFVQSGGR